MDAEGERALLEVYADLRALSRPHPEEEAQLLGSPQERLHAYLRTLDAKHEGLPERFVAGLERALDPLRGRRPRAHRRPGGRRLPHLRLPAARGRGPDRRAAPSSPATSSARARSPAGPTTATAPCSTGWRPRSRRATRARRAGPRAALAVLRPPADRGDAGGDLRARSRGHLDALAEAGADREPHIQALVGCQQPLTPLMARLSADASPAARAGLVEAMTRRYFRIRPLEEIRHERLGGLPFVRSAYTHDGTRYHVAAAWVEPDELPAALRALSELAAGRPGGRARAGRPLRRPRGGPRAAARRRGAARGAGPRGVHPGGRGRRGRPALLHARRRTARWPRTATCAACIP